MSHTGNPRHPNNPPSDYPAEPTGLVAKDSLANESIARGGGFSENENPEVLGVKGYQSTLNNTDTSGAEVLHAASSGAAREAQDFRGLGRDERGEVGVKYPDAEAGSGFDGTHSDQGYRGGSGDAGLASTGGASRTGAFDSTYSGGAGGADSNISSSGYSQPSGGSTGTRPYVDSAPNYTGEQTRAFRTEGELQPKGDNLIEGGDIPPNKSTYMGDVGGQKDPGRLAEREFAKMAADSSGGTGARDYGDGTGDSNTYEALDSSRRA